MLVFRGGSGLAGAGLVAAVIVAGIVARRRKQATAVRPIDYPPSGMPPGDHPGDVQNMVGLDMFGSYGTLPPVAHSDYGQQMAPGPTRDPHAAPPASNLPRGGDPHDQFRPR